MELDLIFTLGGIHDGGIEKGKAETNSEKREYFHCWRYGGS
jgi:hypothetical protein